MQSSTLFPRIHVHALIYETADFWNWKVVSFISACTNLFGDKCMHHYMKKVEKSKTLLTKNIFENLDFLIFIFMFVAVFGHCFVKNREFRLDQA